MAPELICVRCQRPVTVNQQYYGVHERMHWLCFHLEFEHQTDPDEPCVDPSCPRRHIEIYKAKLKALGFDPDEVLYEGLLVRYGQSPS